MNENFMTHGAFSWNELMTTQGNRIKNRNYLKIFVFKNLRFIL